MGQDENTMVSRSKIPAAWETVVPYYNHSQLHQVNNLATKCGVDEVPFKAVEILVKDTGERFFSQYLDWLVSEKPKVDSADLRLCSVCLPNEEASTKAPTCSVVITQALDQQPPAGDQDQEVSNVMAAEKIPSPTEMQICQQPVLPLFPTNPPFWFNPFMMLPSATNSPFCCKKYREYCFQSDRRGRPPHNHYCSLKTTNTNVI
jgi:hypothetical protein